MKNSYIAEPGCGVGVNNPHGAAETTVSEDVVSGGCVAMCRRGRSRGVNADTRSSRSLDEESVTALESATRPAIERHPLEPFLPEGARLLILGSFPPQRKRWSMDFYYPNLQNDMWRIFGHLFFGERNHFLTPDLKAFDRGRIVDFLTQKGIALFDTACAVRRLKDNASDQFLEVVEATDLGALLQRLPACGAVVVTGGKAAETAARRFGCEVPAVGTVTTFTVGERVMRLWRMPSSSRAYPMALERKAEVYRLMLEAEGVIDQ